MKKCNKHLIQNLCVLAFLFAFLLGFSQTKESLESQRIRINQEIENANKVLQKNAQTKQATLDQYAVVERQIASRKQLIETINQELDLNKQSIVNTELALDSVSLLQEELKETYAALLRKRYITLKQDAKWQMILSADGFKNAFLKWQYYQQLDAYFLQKKNELKTVSDNYYSLANQLNADQSFRDSLMQQELAQKNELDNSLNQKTAIIASLETKNSELKQLLKKKNAAREKLNKAIEDAIETAMTSKAPTNTINNNKSNSLKSGTSLNNKLAWPAKNGNIVSTFGRQAHPSIKGLYIENNGVDIRLFDDKNAYAVGEGVVISIQTIPGHDIMVMVQHADYYSIYSKLKTSFVSIDQRVNQGQSIGEVTSEENGTTKLHFEIWQGKTKLDPSLWLK